MTRLLPLLAVAGVSLAPLAAEDRQYSRDTFTWNPELSKSGPVLVTVSLKSQTAAVYRNGIRIGTCKVSTGKPGHKSPTGVFHILNKDADHRSSTYGNAPMPFSERLTWGGVALHAGALPGYPSSHGCIHLPYEFSKLLFGITHKGTTVLITDEAPDAHVSDSHRLQFQTGKTSNFLWNPHLAPDGPVSLLYCSSEKRLFVIRDGHTIGECPVKTGLFAKRPKGTAAFVFTGWKVSGRDQAADSQWIQVSGNADHHREALSSWFKMDPRFQYLLQGLLVPGTNLVVSNEPVSRATRGERGFTVIQGKREEKAEDQ